MTDTSPTLSWGDAPDQFRAAHERQQQELEQAQADAARADVLVRENAMLKAGVDMAHPAAEYFSAGYSGKLEVDDVKAAWEKVAGPAQPPATPPQAPPANDDGSNPDTVARLADLQRQRDQLGQGGVAPGEEPSPDPQTAMLQNNQHLKQMGRNREQAMNLSLDGLIETAVAGDQRVVSTNPQDSVRKWREKNGF